MKLSRQVRQPIIFSIGITIFDCDVPGPHDCSRLRSGLVEPRSVPVCALPSLRTGLSEQTDHRLRRRCCARVVSGQAAVPPPISAMKSQVAHRLRGSPQTRGETYTTSEWGLLCTTANNPLEMTLRS